MIPLRTDLCSRLGNSLHFPPISLKICAMRPKGILFVLFLATSPLSAQTLAPYRQSTLPIEERIHDLVSRMTVEEKARQLDMYAGVPALVDRATDKTHAAPDAAFQPVAAEKLLGNLGAGSIHDLYPSPQLANAIQQWVIQHSRLGIPA